MRRLALAVLVLVAPRAASAELCGPMTTAVTAFHHTERIAAGGGQIVWMKPAFSVGHAGTELQPAWRLRDVNRLVQPRIVPVAPGLAVYELPVMSSPELDLVDPDGEVLGHVERATERDPRPSAPVVTAVESYGSDSYAHVTAVLEEAAPKRMFALVVFRVDDRGTRTGLSFGSGVQTEGDAAKRIVVFRTAHACSATPPWIQPKVGDKVVLAWLDLSGRLSPMSKPVRVSRARRG
jgi:hypothetical protein